MCNSSTHLDTVKLTNKENQRQGENMISYFQNLDVSIGHKKRHQGINLVHFSITTVSILTVKPATNGTAHPDSVQADCGQKL